MYRRHGCGRWVFFAMWETLFVIATTPLKLVARTAESMTAPLHDNGIGLHEQDTAPHAPAAPPPPSNPSCGHNPYHGPQRELQDAQRRGVLFSALDDIRPPRWRYTRTMHSPMESSFRNVEEEREEVMRPLQEMQPLQDIVRPVPQRASGPAEGSAPAAGAGPK